MARQRSHERGRQPEATEPVKTELQPEGGRGARKQFSVDDGEPCCQPFSLSYQFFGSV